MNLSEAYKKAGVKKTSLSFPSPWLCDEDGLLCFGGNMSPDTLVLAYSHGIFPWSVSPVTWWSPEPRAIFEMEKFRLNSRMQRYLRNSGFELTFDKSFKSVMEGCANRAATWISPEFIDSYTRLHELGLAHSAETWLDGKLVGGVYGVSFCGFFAGESMFSAVSNASTFALYHLFERLLRQGFVLFDSQELNEHTEHLGAIEIPKKDYLKRLEAALALDCTF